MKQYTEIGELIKEAKGLLRVSGAEIARRSGINPTSLSRIAIGKARPETSTIKCIAAALDELADGKYVRDGVSGITDRLRDMATKPNQAHANRKKLDAAEYRRAFRAAVERAGLDLGWLEVEADVTYATIKNMLTGRVGKPNPATAQLMGVAAVRWLLLEADKLWSGEAANELRMLAEGIKHGYKTDYGDDLM